MSWRKKKPFIKLPISDMSVRSSSIDAFGIEYLDEDEKEMNELGRHAHDRLIIYLKNGTTITRDQTPACVAQAYHTLSDKLGG